MALTNSPIELLISLDINSGISKGNIDASIRELKKYYDRNPLLISVDFDKTKALNKFNALIKEMNSKQVNLDVSFKQSGNISIVDKMASQAQSAVKEFDELNTVMSRMQKTSSRAFDIDLDRVLIQLDNLSRKGMVASGDLEHFRGSIESLRGTNQRVDLKEIIKDIFDVSSTATHADKVLNGLSNALIEVGQAQQKMTSLKDKFGIDPSTNDSYQRLSALVNNLTDDIIKLQAQASTGGADHIKLADQMRKVQSQLKEAKYELDQFNASAKSGTSFEKAVQEAQRLHSELARVGAVSPARLDEFANAINGIGNSSMASEAKILHLNRAMDSLKDHNKNLKFDMNLLDGVNNAEVAIDKLGAKLTRITQIHKKTFDPAVYSELNNRLLEMSKNLDKVGNPTELKALRREFRTLSAEVDQFGAKATTAARASQGLGDSLKNALHKFPVWMFSATLFYAPIRGIQDLTERVIALDSAMTDLRRVMDIPDYKFNEILEKSIENVTDLSGKMDDYIKIVGEFGRTGKNDTESLALANTATLLQNISELNADEAVSSLTAAMISFGIAAEKSVTIADKLNEVKC